MKLVLVWENPPVGGCAKVYLRVSNPQTALERKICKALKTSKPRYIAGAEPKFSLYLGEPIVAKEEVAVEKKEAYIPWRGSMRRWVSDYYKANPEYSVSCRCGCQFKSEKAYNRHKRSCSVIASLKKFFERVASMQEAKAFSRDPENKSKGKKRKKRRSAKDDGTKATKKFPKVKKTVSKRGSSRNKKARHHKD